VYITEINSTEEQLVDALKELLIMKDTIATLENEQKMFKEKSRLINVNRSNNEKTKFYTGLNSWNIFFAVFELYLPGMESITSYNAKKCKLTFQEQLLLTLMRLRLNLKMQYLAYQFDISLSSTTRYAKKWIDVMYVRLAKPLLLWPVRDELLLSMPMFYRRHFRDCVCIIDCFEVSCQRFSDLLDRASTYSSYKSRPTVKFLIAITAQGTISYISQGYGGLSSDVFITEDSKHIVVPEDQNFLTKLLPHDVVLSDRGFLIAESVAMMGAELVTPAFKGLRPRITQLEVEQSRRISNVRIHVERVIGQLRKSFNILQENLNVYEVQLDADGLAFIDKIAFLLWIIARNRY
jgi:hypothetical protein